MVGSSEIFKGISNEDYDIHLFPTLIEIIGFTYSFRRIVFDSYRHLVLTLIPMLIILLAVSFAYRECNFLSILGEFSAVTLFVITQIVETNIVESRTIQLFYRMEKEETSHEVNLKKKPKLDQIEPENKNFLALSLEKKCDFVISELKYASSVIIFRDIKSRLKIAQSEIVKIKNKIEKITSDTNFDIITHDLDEQDKEFIAQNFLKVSTIGRPQSNHKHTRTGFQSKHAHLAHSLISGVQDYLAKLGEDWNFSMFYIQEKTNKTISVISSYMFTEYSLDRTLKIPEETFVSFFDSVESSYKSNPYHNASHGADVFTSFYYFYKNTEIQKYSTQLDVVSFIIAALGHDVGHPGVTNRFLVSSRDKIAIQYNDNSVLENMHCSILFTLMGQDNNDILVELNEEEWSACRKMVISMILDTDLSKHFEICSKFKAKVLVQEQDSLVIGNQEDKILVYSMGLKCADIAHSGKSRNLHLKWTALVIDEFFGQGDVEKAMGLPVSMYCDRLTTDVAKSQAGFIRNICIPLFENWAAFTKSEKVDACLKQMRENYLFWDESYKNSKWVVEKLD